jgi:hypothetical protein
LLRRRTRLRLTAEPWHTHAANKIAEWLAAREDGAVEPGLSEAELSRAEKSFGMTFPPLWRAVLGLASGSRPGS